MVEKIPVKQAISNLYQRKGAQPIKAYEAEVAKRSYTTGDAFSATIIALFEMSYVKVDGRWQARS